MPQGWGRPPKNKRSRGWNRPQEYYSDRFEELSSGEDEDVLLFTGADPRSVPRNVHEYTDETEESEEQNSDENGMQLVVQERKMRAKEEDLVSSALARMQRAKAKGKREVEMPVEERDALERKIERDQAKGRKTLGEAASGRRQSGEKPRSSSKSSSRSHRKSARSSMTNLDQVPPNPPGMVVAGPDGPMLVPYGAPGHRLPPSARFGDMPRASSSQNLISRGGRRWVSGPEPGPSSSSPALAGGRSSSSRPLPDDPDWQPQRPRAYSSTHRHSRHDPYHEYSLPPPIPQRFKPEYGATMGASASDPALQRRSRRRHAPPESSSPSEDESGSSSSDEDGEGVEVDVASDEAPTAKSPRRTSGQNNTASSSGAVAVRSSAGRQRKGRR